MRRCHYILAFAMLAGLMVGTLASCSTQKNTASSRWWHGFNARYNTYYNGVQAYIEGSLAKENGHKDNFTETLPLYAVGSKQSRELGKGNYETAITKSQKAIRHHSIKKRPLWTKKRRKTERDIEWLSRREYNPFIWKAWMLMGRSQFHSGAFDEAAATFSYMSRLYHTQPAIYGKARAWLAKCYIEQDWLYDAEDVIRNMRRDSIDWRCRKEWDYTLADYYLHTGQPDSAAVYLRRVIKHEMRKKQKAREWYILGQLYSSSGRYAEAYDAFRHVIKQNPPYILEFNARIAMTEVMPGVKAKQKIASLRRMARSDKNAEYLDQVYYALGNVYLAERDTTHAIGAYEKGVEKGTRSGIEKGVLLLTLGNLYWTMERFSDSRRCYTDAIGMLDKNRPDYDELQRRSKILDELVPHTESIHLQDSLQSLARMSEKDRNEAIDRVISALKKKEREERLAKLDAEAQQNGGSSGMMPNNSNRNNPSPAPAATMPSRNGGLWYFYNPAAVSQGKQAFQRQWGQRPDEDNWRRSNKTVVASASSATDEGETGNAMYDAATEAADSLAGDAGKSDTLQNDPHNREYYLAQIPFTDEQIAASNQILSDAIFNAAVIFKDKLDHTALSEHHFMRLVNSFADYSRMDEVCYHLFLLYSHKGETATAEQWRSRLKDSYKDSEWTHIVCDPHFEENARCGTHLEDSLYAETYNAFRDDRHDIISRNASISETRYPDGANRPRFLFISGMSRLAQNDADSCLRSMNRIVEKYPDSGIAVIAGMIVKGVSAGRRLNNARFGITNIWDRRTTGDDAAADSTSVSFSADTDVEFCFLMTYAPDSLAAGSGENRLLYNIARHNFTSYLVRNFDIDIEEYAGMHRLTVRGFRNMAESREYARSLYADKAVQPFLAASRNIIISSRNLALLGTQLSYNDYDTFYRDSLAADGDYALPSTLDEQTSAEEDYPDLDIVAPVPTTRQTGQSDTDESGTERSASEPSSSDKKTPDNGETPDSGDSILIMDGDINEDSHATEGTTIIDLSPDTATRKAEPSGTSATAPAQKDSKQAELPTRTSASQQKGEQPVPVQKMKNTTATSRKPVSTTRQDINADVIEIIDESAQKAATKQSQKQKKAEAKEKARKTDDDEYFELDGF